MQNIDLSFIIRSNIFYVMVENEVQSLDQASEGPTDDEPLYDVEAKAANLATLNQIAYIIGQIAFSDDDNVLNLLYSKLPETHNILLDIADIQLQEYQFLKEQILNEDFIFESNDIIMSHI